MVSLGLAAAPLEFDGGLELRLDVVLAAHRDLGFLHQLEQRGLHAAAAYVAPVRLRGAAILSISSM